VDIESATELFYIVLNTFLNECVPDRIPSKLNRPPWFTNALQKLKNLETNKHKKYKKYVVARSDFNVLNSHCYSMYFSRCKFEFSNDPKQFYNFFNAKRNLSALPSSVHFNSRHRRILKLVIYLPSFAKILIIP